MTSEFAAAHDELRAVARDLLPKVAGGDAAWSRFAAAGWLGLEVPAPLGGAGATFAEVAVVLEEMGRAATPGPFLGTVALGVGALGLAAPGDARDALLGAVASGDARVAVALDGHGAGVGPPPFRLTGGGGDLRLTGEAAFVPDAEAAEHLLLPALGPDGAPVLVHAGPDGPRPAVTPQPVLDATRRLAAVAADGLAVPAGAVWRLAAPGEGFGPLALRAAVAVACDSVGVAAAMLDATVAYAGARRQFGRPIGSFQAVKHACADMLVASTVARALVAEAVEGVAAGRPDAAAVARAKAHATATAVDVVGTALQLHGGIGYTWESGVHAYLKRAALDRSLYGSPRAHRRRLVAPFADGPGGAPVVG
jgi:alkylation response protein AidB-like acyl-CoA dehydrogenase